MKQTKPIENTADQLQTIIAYTCIFVKIVKSLGLS